VGIEAFGRRRRRGYRGHASSAPIVRFLLAARIVGIETGLRAVRFHDTKRAARDGGAKFGRVADTTAALAFRLLLANAGVVVEALQRNTGLKNTERGCPSRNDRQH